MGNCWRMPEDHSGLLHVSETNFTSRPVPATVPATHTYTAFNNSISSLSDTHIPKSVTLSRSSADLNAIKAAQCRNLVEHLPLINYKEKLIQQTECDICLMDFVPDELLRQLPCEGAHVFHPACIDQWLEKCLTCPHCSTNVDAALFLRFIPKFSKDDDDDW